MTTIDDATKAPPVDAAPPPPPPPPPQAPPPPMDPPTASEGGDAVEVDGTIDADLFEKVPEAGATVPDGKYHMRLDFFMESVEKEKSAAEQPFGPQPQFLLRWVVQQEPFVGYSVVQYIDWVSPEVTALAKSGDRKATAYYINRLQQAKKLTSRLGWQGKDIKDFFNSSPEAKVRVTLTDKKTYDENRKLKSTGEKQNRVIDVEPIFSQR